MNINFIFLIFIILLASKFISLLFQYYIQNYHNFPFYYMKIDIKNDITMEIIIFFIIYLNYQNIFMLVNILCLLIISITDIRYGEISDLSLLIILISICLSHHINIYPAILCLLIGIFMSLFKLIGFGDVKLIVIYALILDYYQLLILLFLSSLFAIVYHNKKEQTIKFAPYLSIAIYLILLNLK